jgi:hypothetical protein
MNARINLMNVNSGIINGWNRLNVAARTVPGEYVPRSLATHAAR